MMLPAGVDKASGVQAALKELGVSRHNLVAIGDGENDLALFEFAEHAVAVQNADAALKRVADRTTQGAYCDGFLELAHELVATDLATRVPRHKIVLGLREDRQEVEPRAVPRFAAGLRAGRQRQGRDLQSTAGAVAGAGLPMLHHRRGPQRRVSARRPASRCSAMHTKCRGSPKS